MKKVFGLIKKAAASYIGAITKAYNDGFYMYGAKY